MNDIEAFLLFLSYIFSFGGITQIFIGITESDKTKIVFGSICSALPIFIMGYLLCMSKNEKKVLIKSEKKNALLLPIFRHIFASDVLMIAEFLLLSNFGFSFRYIVLIICLSLVIMTIIVTMLKKL